MPKKNLVINTAARAVMPDGKRLSRPQVLRKLGLDPRTPADAWLVITSCGSNAAALRLKDTQKLLRSRKITTRLVPSKTLAKIRR